MKRLRPFFSFYGSKWQIAPLYPRPECGTIIEPFAGSASYATLYHDLNVKLYDADPVIVGVWDYLIRAKRSEINWLPTHVDDVRGLKVCQEAKWLIGFFLNNATSQPCMQMSKWGREKGGGIWWGDETRSRVADQVELIKHWSVTLSDYSEVENEPATWFVDPPYCNDRGKHYKKQPGSFGMLSMWCREREGQVIVCENTGADWLPFKHLANAGSSRGSVDGRVSAEAMWTNRENVQLEHFLIADDF